MTDDLEGRWLAVTPKDPNRKPKMNILELIAPALLLHAERDRITPSCRFLSRLGR
jgi:hypothetical protein